MENSTREKPRKPGFIFVAWQDTLEKKPFVSVRIMGKTVAVFGGTTDQLFAREMSCKHQGADLTAGAINGLKVTCSRHGWQYDLSTGECINRDSPPLRAHEVVVEDGAVFVALFPK
jgi:nitrite reductase/ring-hydroxylating ferredoxin subunit